MSAGDAYSPVVNALLTLGAGRSRATARFTPDHVAWPNYPATCGLGKKDVGELVAMLGDLALDQGPGPMGWARVHAYRALGQLKAGAAGKALIAAFDTAIRQKDDRARAELPMVLEMIGAAVCEEAVAGMQDRALDPYVHVVLASVLAGIGQTTRTLRGRCIEALMAALQQGQQNDPRLNSGLILSLKLLNTPKADKLIQQVCRAGLADEQMLQYALRDSGAAKDPAAAGPGLQSNP